MKLEIFQQIFEECSNNKFHKELSSWSRSVPRCRTEGQTDGHNKANSRNLENTPTVQYV